MYGNTYEVISVDHQRDEYCLQQRTTGNTYTVVYYSNLTISSLVMAGKAKIISQKGTKQCQHEIDRYIGFREVFDYCKRCKFVKTVDWRELK